MQMGHINGGRLRLRYTRQIPYPHSHGNSRAS